MREKEAEEAKKDVEELKKIKALKDRLDGLKEVACPAGRPAAGPAGTH